MPATLCFPKHKNYNYGAPHVRWQISKENGISPVKSTQFQRHAGSRLWLFYAIFTGCLCNLFRHDILQRKEGPRSSGITEDLSCKLKCWLSNREFSARQS
jgi:hypothetical protein